MNNINKIELVKCPNCLEIDTELNTFLRKNQFNCLHCDIVFSKDQVNLNNISDGYHTFEELYYHKMVMFSIICNQNKDKACKSKLHADGTMYKNHFIAEIKTPEGNFSYHFDLKYWDWFEIPAVEKAPKWDGHQPKDIDRLLSLYHE